MGAPLQKQLSGLQPVPCFLRVRLSVTSPVKHPFSIDKYTRSANGTSKHRLPGLFTAILRAANRSIDYLKILSNIPEIQSRSRHRPIPEYHQFQPAQINYVYYYNSASIGIQRIVNRLLNLNPGRQCVDLFILCIRINTVR